MLAPRSFLFTRKHAPASSQQKSNPKRRNDQQAMMSPESSAAGSRVASASPYSSTLTSPVASKPVTSEPVIIPVRSNGSIRESTRRAELKERFRTARTSSDASPQRPRDIHSPDSIPSSVSALLALTSIPIQRSRQVPRSVGNKTSERLTVDAILSDASASEKEFSMSFGGKSPMEMLLSPPDELSEDETMNESVTESSYLSSRTISMESVPSLDENSLGQDTSSLSSIKTPSPRMRKRSTAKRTPSLASPSRQDVSDHPLSNQTIDIDEVDFRVFQPPAVENHSNHEVNGVVETRRKSAFKSNLTASLRALRSAAKSFSNITSLPISPDDFLTRSMISIDPQVPFTDERMPPRLEDTPTPALRRYLNPTTNAPIEAHVPSSLAQTTGVFKCSASIQMQTYKISKSSKSIPVTIISRRTTSTPEEVFQEVTIPVARQRDMRENSDFIRIAVLEMMMRKNGKLDEKVPGRAKWALPPRKPPTRVYEIGAGGIPARWIPTLP